MGNKSSKANFPYVEEDENGLVFKPKEFPKLLSKIQILSQFENNPFFYREINIKKDLSNKVSKYLRLNEIKRFCIPIMGIISSGKSTFMNYLLQLNNILEVGDLICTQFICIIRHDEKVTIPEIYEVSIKKRYDEAFNFEEKRKIPLDYNGKEPYEILKEKIKKRNHEITFTKKNEDEKSEKYLEPEDYFLIIKTKIPLFEGEYKDYGELIDFLDIPGLDENGDSNFDNFIKPIFKNILFPIFISDFQNYTHDGPKKIIKKFLENYYEINPLEEKKLFNIGFYILNKMDLLYSNNSNDSKEDIINNFIEIFSTIETDLDKISLFIKENVNFIDISARELCKGNPNNKMDEVIKEIIKESEKSSYNSFKRFIKKFFKTKYNIDLEKGKKEKEDKNLEQKCVLYNQILKDNIKRFIEEPKLTLNEYSYINNNISKELISQPDERVKELIQKKIKNNLDEILTFKLNGLVEKISSQEQTNAMKKANNSIKNIDSKFFIKYFNRKVKQLIGEEDESTHNNKEIKEEDMSLYASMDMFQLDGIIDYFANDKYKKINEIIKKINDFEEFYHKKKIRIIFLGKISSGKTSLMNSIIGHNYNILPITVKENTNNIFILKYSSSFIKLCESKLIENENGNFFDEVKILKVLDDSQIKNKDEIDNLRKSIKDLNEENKFKYFTLYIPIEGLEEIENNQDIELIDMPGIKESIDRFDKINLESLINLTDGFIFSFNAINIRDNSSQILLLKIINYIKNRKDSFDFGDCLFNLNCIDQFKEEQIEDVKNIFEKEIKCNFKLKLFNGNFIERIHMKENISSIKFNISYFSNTKYSLYQEIINKIESLEFIKIENFETLEEIDSFLNDEYPNLINKYEIETDKDKINDINIKLKQLIQGKDDDLSNKISKNIISILNNKKQLQIYKDSFASFFFNEFYKQINFSKMNNEKQMKIKVISHCFRILYYLFYIDSLCQDINKIEQLKFKIKEKKNLLQVKFKEYEKSVDNLFENLLEKINQIQSEIKIKMGASKLVTTKTRSVIIKFIKKEKVELKIKELLNKLVLQLNLLKNEFIKEDILIISDVLENSEKFENIFGGILQNFQMENYFKKSFKKNILATSLFAIGIIISFIPILEVVGGIIAGIGELIFFYNPDTLKIDDYFNYYIKNIVNYKNLYKKELKNIMKKFIQELNNLEAYSKNEIEYLINRDFHSNFNNLVEDICN